MGRRTVSCKILYLRPLRGVTKTMNSVKSTNSIQMIKARRIYYGHGKGSYPLDVRKKLKIKNLEESHMRKSQEKHSRRNKSKKKFSLAVIFIVIVLSFFGCGETTDTISGDAEEVTENTDSETKADDYAQDIADETAQDTTDETDGLEEDGNNIADADSVETEKISGSISLYPEDDKQEDEFSADEDSVTAESQTNNMSATSESTDISKEPTEESVEEPTAVSAGTDYILNMNTKKFHYPDCSSVGQMAEKNKWAYTGNRDDVIAMGYVPCKRCNP